MMDNITYGQFCNETLIQINAYGYVDGVNSPACTYVIECIDKNNEQTFKYLHQLLIDNIDNDYIVENVLHILAHIKVKDINIWLYMNNMINTILNSIQSNNSIIIDLIVKCCEHWNTIFILPILDCIINKQLIAAEVKQFAKDVKLDILSSIQGDNNEYAFIKIIMKLYPNKTEDEVIEFINNKNGDSILLDYINSRYGDDKFYLSYDMEDKTYRIIFFGLDYKITQYKKASNPFYAFVNAKMFIDICNNMVNNS